MSKAETLLSVTVAVLAACSVGLQLTLHSLLESDHALNTIDEARLTSKISNLEDELTSH